jgi:photosystem II stability/assembly factor-like uncharacterized protein
MSYQKLRLTIILSALTLTLSACSISTTNSTGGSTAVAGSSIFLSMNSGQNWRPMVSVPKVSGQIQTIANLNVNTMTMDPEDSSAIYLASDNGLYYTYNITDGWNQVTSLPIANINDVKVDPQNKCIVYAAFANRLYRSDDCTRTWIQAYFDNDPNVSVTTVVVDYAHTQNVYIGTSRGDIVKSIDYGHSWRTIHRLDNGVGRLTISPLNSNLLFVASNHNEIYSFTSNSNTNAADSGNIDQNFAIDNWTDMNTVLKDYSLGNNFTDITLGAKDGVVYLATDKLILRSPDNGISWENIKLIQPAKNATINAIAVNPQDSNDLYYVTNTVFFHSRDGGVTWTTQNLPAGRGGRTLLIDFKNPSNIYLGMVKLKN